MSRPTGTIMAPPSPCRMRIRVNCVSVWAMLQKSDARVKMPMAAAKTVREPKRSATQPLMGMKTASVSRYAVMPMLRLTAPTWKLFAICGSAVAMMVPSRFSIKNAAAMRVVT